MSKRKATTARTAKKAQVKYEDDGMDITETEKRSRKKAQDSDPEDEGLSEYGTIKSKNGEVSFKFSRKAAQLRNVVQMVCGNFNRQHQPHIPVVSLQDLWFGRPMFRHLLSKQAAEGGAEDDEDEEEAKENYMEQSLNRISEQLRNQYLGGSGFGGGMANTGGKPPAGLEELILWVEEKTAPRKQEILNIIQKGMITFDGLSEYFKIGEGAIGYSRDTGASPIGYRVLNTIYHSSLDLCGNKIRVFQITLEFLVSSGKKFIPVTYVDTIHQFMGSISQERLELKAMSPEMRRSLIERGKQYSKLSRDHHYLCYDGDSFLLHMKKKPVNPGGGFGHIGETQNVGASSFLRSSGRVMIDTDVGKRLGHYPASSYVPPGSLIGNAIVQHQNSELQSKQNAASLNAYSFGYHHHLQPGNHSFEDIPEDLLPYHWPALTGFSFTAKAWGHVVIEGLSEIVYDDHAFDHLVLEETRKDLIRAIVKHSETVFKDIISGKGGGSIFLLHGPPGTGKTLTAEAVAEMLHKPMYTVSMGELGTDPKDLENNLSDILELATVWKALVLIDEADIFLERRGQKEIVRNAMVGVLLRQIEYYQGVLFLTSNRVDVFDEAFHSRVTVGLKYEQLTLESRTQVWENLFKVAKIHDIDPKLFSKYELNGRQIKNCISLAQGLARSAESPVTVDHLRRTIAVALDFKQEMLPINERQLERSASLTGF